MSRNCNIIISVNTTTDYTTLSGFPATGEAGIWYRATNTGKIYRWHEGSYQNGISGVWPAFETPLNLLNDLDIHLLDSPDMVTPPVRDYETQEYPESAEAEMDHRTSLKPFDYKLTLGYFGDETTANAKIRALFDAMFSVTNSDILYAMPILLQNQYKGVQMEGYAKSWNGKTFSEAGNMCLFSFEFPLYVNNPYTFVNI